MIVFLLNGEDLGRRLLRAEGDIDRHVLAGHEIEHDRARTTGLEAVHPAVSGEPRWWRRVRFRKLLLNIVDRLVRRDAADKEGARRLAAVGETEGAPARRERLGDVETRAAERDGPLPVGRVAAAPVAGVTLTGATIPFAACGAPSDPVTKQSSAY